MSYFHCLQLIDISDDEMEVSSEDGCSEVDDMESDERPRHWNGISLDDMIQDLDSHVLPPPKPVLLGTQKATALIQWMCFFVIYWQLVCLISDNGLEWLLSFIYQFLQVINSNIDSVFIKEILVLFPTTMYMIRKLIKLHRDNFTKYVACPKCKALYELDQCTKKNTRT